MQNSPSSSYLLRLADMTTVRWSAVKFCHTAQTSLPASLALAGLVGWGRWPRLSLGSTGPAQSTPAQPPPAKITTWDNQHHPPSPSMVVVVGEGGWWRLGRWHSVVSIVPWRRLCCYRATISNKIDRLTTAKTHWHLTPVTALNTVITCGFRQEIFIEEIKLKLSRGCWVTPSNLQTLQ